MTVASMTLLAGLAVTVVCAGQPQQKLPVQLVDKANDGYLDYTLSETLASRMFAAIGIHLDWTNGKVAAESSRAPILMEVVTRTPLDFLPGSLAYSVPHEGSRITVFLDRIEQMRDPSRVLAHVMVHEITHVLQGIRRHSATGVMKEAWTASDFGGMRLRPLPFTAVDIELIHAGLAARQQAKKGRIQDTAEF